ncbi:MAG TPA: GntR family transcriptional regulator [Patescibacteria group bacterium]|nr:GntR family transcriptional regulator [Patescibacteria group bacterium]
MGRLNKAASIPLYVQIKEQLLIQIKAEQGSEGPARRIASEEQLAELYEVSRMTVRQALQELVDEGRLYKVRGVGTFIASGASPSPDTAHLTRRWDKTVPGTERKEVLAFQRLPVPAEWSGCLRLEKGDLALYIIRRRWRDRIPVAIDYRYVVSKYAGALTQEMVMVESLFSLVSSHMGVTVEHTESLLGAVAASEQEAEWLQVAVGAPLLKRKTVIYLTGNIPVIAGESVYCSDTYWYAFSTGME